MPFHRYTSNNSGAAAVEFALIAPLFFLTLLSLVAYGIYFSAAHSVQQLAADAARTAVAGLNETERETLVADFVNRSTMNHALIDKTRLSLQVQADPSNPNQFTVSLSYDASNLPIFNLFTYAMPEKQIRRFATVRVGGI
ncbi:Flp pilus assembly protein TadG [Rhizobium sp. NFR07]|uniref:TadE family protein n=1 Tax=Rhizobium sp. NFR07 TaxID=1566262 RepID=UPI0008F3C972|nr:TadE/TadG family type IV pilus assembly protein [Rhizobium sp. NFR07]SFB39151.1 Flp pilus assembly protein TadG [Rhizobium sp. NFR07]